MNDIIKRGGWVKLNFGILSQDFRKLFHLINERQKIKERLYKSGFEEHDGYLISVREGDKVFEIIESILEEDNNLLLKQLDDLNTNNLNKNKPNVIKQFENF